MAKVMMRCTTTNLEFFTGLDIPRKSGLRGLPIETVDCPHCKHYHYLRLPYFEGDYVDDNAAGGVLGNPAFAIEVGYIITSAVFMESYIPQVYAKVTGLTGSDAIVTLGAFPSTSTKISLLEVIRNLQPENSDLRKDLTILCEKFRTCSTLRNFYAHAKFNCGKGNIISIIPFFGDSRKPPTGIVKTIDEVRDDSEFMRKTQFMIREYLMTEMRPKR
ncbi:hypothetical protein [Aestuariivirga sp.]|uniref:hypothetical protein n=1 Tax=Aestuariivirga sp. TaxID=2650926 RepID=UPI003593B119